MLTETDLALVLAGGNALGAYHAGACEVLHERGLLPGRMVGASTGAVTAAILAGNPPEQRLSRLRQFWAVVGQHSGPSPGGMLRPRQVYNAVHALHTVFWGRPGIFRHRFPGLWSALPGMPDDVALFDHGPLRETLTSLIDFGRLAGGETRLTVACVDVETGEDVYFDSHHGAGLRPEHILASAAMMPAFPPVEIDGRLLCDAGYTNNLPLDPLFLTEPPRDLLCIALDLFSPRAPRPRSLDAVLERANDLIFASAPRRAIAGLRREYALRSQLRPDGSRATLLHLTYQAAADQLAAKSLDFSPSSLADRWSAGARDMAAGLEFLARRDLNGRRGEGRFAYFTQDDLGATDEENARQPPSAAQYALPTAARG